MSSLDLLLWHAVARGIDPAQFGFSLISITQTMFANRDAGFDDLDEVTQEFCRTADVVLAGVLEAIDHKNLQVEVIEALSVQIGLSAAEFKLAAIRGAMASLNGFIDALEGEDDLVKGLRNLSDGLEKTAAEMAKRICPAGVDSK